MVHIVGTKIKCKGYNRISALQKQGQMPYKEKSLMEELYKIHKFYPLIKENH